MSTKTPHVALRTALLRIKQEMESEIKHMVASDNTKSIAYKLRIKELRDVNHILFFCEPHTIDTVFKHTTSARIYDVLHAYKKLPP